MSRKGLIFKDDITAQACVALLARESLKEIQLAVQTNLQVPLSFALVPIAFALDVDELARVSVDQLMDRLLRPGVVLRSHLIIPRRQRGRMGMENLIDRFLGSEITQKNL